MKKLLLTTLIALLAAVPMVSAQSAWSSKTPTVRTHKLEKLTEKKTVKTQQRSRAGVTIDFSYAAALSTAFGLNETGETGMAMCIPASKAATFKGGKITKVSIGFGESTDKNFDLLIGSDLTASDVYTESLTYTKEGAWNEFVLKTPYEITGEDVYVGYLLTNKAGEYPLGVCAESVYNENGLFLYLDGAWYPGYQAAISYNGSIAVTIEGVELADNVATMSYLEAPYYIKPNETTELYLEFVNDGGNAINNIEVMYQLGEDAIVSKAIQLETPINYGEVTGCYVEDVVYKGGYGKDILAAVAITKVNGVEVAEPQAGVVAFWSGDTYYDRVLVVEEGTGTWCGYCPMGITAMSQMKANHPDTFIGIAVHRSYSIMQRDPMQTSTYSDAYYSGYPSANYNRYYNDVSADPETMELAYLLESVCVSPLKVDIVAATTAEDLQSIKVETEVHAAIDYSNLALAYVVIENQVGPYSQTNYFSPEYDSQTGMGPNDERYGWGDKEKTVEMLYDDVARDIFDYAGIAGSVSEKVAKGQVDKNTYDVNLRNVQNVNNCEVVVLLLDTATGEIMSADKIAAIDAAGVNEIEVDSSDVPAVTTTFKA